MKNANTYSSRKSKLLPMGDQAKFFQIKREDIKRSYILDTFSATSEAPAKYNTYDLLTLDKDTLKKYGCMVWAHKNFPAKPFETTIGCFILNLFLFDCINRNNIEYININWDKDVCSDLNDDMVFLLVDGKIDTEQYRKFINRFQWFGLCFAKYFVPSFDTSTLSTRPEVKKRREELLAKNQDAVYTGNAVVANEIRNELLALAKDSMKKNKFAGYELFESGVANFGNHYGNVSVMRGALPKSGDTNHATFNFCTSSLNEGIKKSEIHKFADLMVLASFSRSVNTQVGGYINKQYIAAFQHLVIGDAGSDCKTKLYDELTIDKSNIKSYHLNYVMGKGDKDWVLLTGDMFSKYIDTRVKMRSALYCNDTHYCSKCTGELYHRIGIKNVGLLTGRIASKLLNASLKFFHNTQIHFLDISLNDHLVPIKTLKKIETATVNHSKPSKPTAAGTANINSAKLNMTRR